MKPAKPSTNDHASEPELTVEEVRARSARGALSAFTRHALVRFLAFAGTLWLARMIAPASFGLFSTSQFLLTALSAVCVGGVISALVRRAEAISKEELRTAFAVQQGMAVVICIGLFFAAPLIARLYHLQPNDAWVFRSMMLAVFLMSLKSIPNAMLQRRLRHDLVALSEIIEYLVYISSAVLLASLGWGVWALVVATLLRHASAVLMLHRAARIYPSIGFNLSMAKALIRFALPLQAISLVDLANRSVVPLLIGGMLGMAAVGLSSMANTILDAAILQPLVLLSALQLRLFARVQRDPAEVRRLLGQFYFMGGAAVGPIAVLLFCAAPMLPHVLSSQWSHVGWLVQALFFASILQVVAAPTAQAAKALGEVRAPLIAGVVSLGAQILILTFTYKSLGLTSYPLAAAVGGCCSTGLILYRVARRIDGLSMASLVPVAISCFLAGVTWWLAGRYAGAQPVLIIAALILGGLVYVASLLLLAGAQVSRYIGVIAETTAKNQPALVRILNWLSSTTTSLDMVARVRTRAGGVQFR